MTERSYTPESLPARVRPSTRTSLLLILFVALLAPAALAADPSAGPPDRAGTPAFTKLADDSWRFQLDGVTDTWTEEDPLADLLRSERPPSEWTPLRFADNENAADPDTPASPYNHAWSTSGGASIGYTTERAYHGARSVKAVWPGGSGTGIARTWMHAAGNNGDTCTAAWARRGDDIWTGAAFYLPHPRAHSWSRLLGFSYYGCFQRAPWSVVAVVATHGQLQVWTEDYHGGPQHVRLITGVPAPAGRWFRLDLGVHVGDPGAVEMVVDGISYSATGTTITEPGAYVSAQHGLGTVAGPAVTEFYDDAYVATTKRP